MSGASPGGPCRPPYGAYASPARASRINTVRARTSRQRALMMFVDQKSTISLPASACPECCFGVKASTWTPTVEVPAPDDVRARRVRLGSRPLTHGNTEVWRVGALSAPARPKEVPDERRARRLLSRESSKAAESRPGYLSLSQRIEREKTEPTDLFEGLPSAADPVAWARRMPRRSRPPRGAR